MTMPCASGDAVIIENLSKRFRRYGPRKRISLKEALLHPSLLGGQNLSPDLQLLALDNVSFRIARGATIGIVGRNGSGKTTLLRTICGIYRADGGRIRIHGRLSTLLGLGVGFHQEMSGRENILINGLVLGLTARQIEEQLEEIVEFAELEEFIDAPVRTYSSGMFVRLAFSIAVNVNPDILLLDEVLAVGDAGFQRKCKERMESYRQQGKTIILVTHDMGTAEAWCDRVLWLHRGKLVADGEPRQVIAEYLAASESVSEEQA